MSPEKYGTLGFGSSQTSQKKMPPTTIDIAQKAMVKIMADCITGGRFAP